MLSNSTCQIFRCVIHLVSQLKLITCLIFLQYKLQCSLLLSSERAYLCFDQQMSCQDYQFQILEERSRGVSLEGTLRLLNGAIKTQLVYCILLYWNMMYD
jgi:hypothetical protein